MSIKATCPNCQKTFKAPNEFAGKRVKCPGCQTTVTVPAADAKAQQRAPGGLDLSSLAAIEQGGEAVVRDTSAKPMSHKEALAAATAARSAQLEGQKAAIKDPTVRICPQCGQKAKSEDIYIELICKHCGAGIPGREFKEKTTYTSGMDRLGKGLSFYAGFTGALAYPTRAITSILMAAGIAVGSIAVPMLGVLGFTKAANLNPVSTDSRAAAESSDSWVAIFLYVMFLAEGLYFGAVAYYAAIDTIRATTANNEQAPGLTWNPVNIGAALGGYATLMAVFTGVILLLAGGIPNSQQDFQQLTSPLSLIILGLLTFGVPMNLIGLSSSHAADGLNPARVGKSISRLFGHYTFLFLVFLIYLGLNFGVIFAIMNWAGPAIKTAAEQGMKAGIGKVLGGVGAWGVVIGAAFYFAYCIGRVLGLFSRTYRAQLDFEM